MVEGTLDVDGAVAFWTAAEFTDRDRLRAGLDALGLGHLAPDPRAEPAVLKDALADVFANARTLVRPLADRRGFAVVQEDRGQAGNAYATVLTARVAGVDPAGFDYQPPTAVVPRVVEVYRKHAGRVPAAQLSACLVRVVEALGGTRLRPTGAVYWVPGHRLDEWAAVGRAVEAAADGRPSAVYLLRHRLDADAVRAVRDAVVADVRAEADRIRQDVDTGELGARALETRQRLAGDLRGKVRLYEELLHVTLADLHQAVDAADQAAAMAALLLGAAPTDPTDATPTLAAR